MIRKVLPNIEENISSLSNKSSEVIFNLNIRKNIPKMKKNFLKNKKICFQKMRKMPVKYKTNYRRNEENFPEK
jgi:hypothetical protein